MLHLLAELAVLRLRRHFQTLAVNIEEPAMIRTAQSAIFDIAVLQRGAAMRTMLAKQTELAVGIAKQHQILAEHFAPLEECRKDRAPCRPPANSGETTRRPGVPGPTCGISATEIFRVFLLLPVFTVESFSYVRDGLNVLNGLNMLSWII